MAETHTGRCLVTGATGALGPAVVRALVSDGWRVRGLSRTPSPTGLLPESVEVVAGDVTDAGAVRAAMQDVEVVMHLAAKLHITNPDPALRSEYERVNVGGTRAVVEAARAAAVRRVVYFSTISVYGPTRGHAANEATPPAPETMYASTKHDGERIVLSAAATAGPPATVLRLAAVYGPRVKGNYARLLQALARRRFVPVGDGSNRRTIVHEDDAVRAALLAARHDAAADGVFNVTDGGSHTLDEIIGAMCVALGRRSPAVTLPVGPVRLGAAMVERAARLVGRRLPLEAAVEKYLEEVVVDGVLLQQRLGYRPAVTLEAGWRATVAALRRSGEL